MANDAINIEGIKVSAKGEDAEVLIYNNIGQDNWTGEGTTAKAFAEAIAGFKKVKNINVRLNSPGGSVFDAAAIFNTLKQHPANVTVSVDGAALSAASIVAMAGNKIRMAKNAFMMIHDPYSYARGTADEMRGAAEMLDNIKQTMVATYQERTGQPAEKIAEMMSKETWMNATQAKELGFVDEIIDAPAVAAEFKLDPQAFTNIPDEFKKLQAACKQPVPSQATELNTMPDANVKAATVAEIKAACEGCSSDFILAQVEANSTIEQVSAAWSKHLANQVKALHKDLETVKAELETAKKLPEAPVGAKPLASGKDDGGESCPIEKWNSLKAEFLKKYDDPMKAIQMLNRQHPGLRQAMLDAVNSK